MSRLSKTTGKPIVKLSNKQREIVKRAKTGKKLSKSDITVLLTISTKNFSDFVDKVPINVTLVVDGKSYTEGLYLHASGWNEIKTPLKLARNAHTVEGQKEIDRYKQDEKFRSRALRSQLLRRLLHGEKLHSTGITIGRGHPNTIDKTLPQDKRMRNVAEQLGLEPNDVTLAIAKSSDKSNYNADLLTGKLTTEPSRGYTTPGGTYAMTNKTINGKRYALKLNRTKISEEHASILYRAFIARGAADRGDTGPLKDFLKSPDTKGIAAHQVTDLLVIHGRKRTDPKFQG